MSTTPQKTVHLLELIQTVVPYVLATIDPAIRQPDHTGWGKIHAGRAYSSANQLTKLLEVAEKFFEETE